MSKVSKKQLPDLDTLRDLLHYNAATGDFTWKKKASPWSRVRVGDSAGHINDQGRVILSIGRSPYKAARIAWYMETGQDPSDMIIDHISGDVRDNRFSNLRMVSAADNQRNVKKHRDTDKLMGVTRVKGKFRVMVSTKYIGEFKDFFDAACARISAQNAAGYHKNHGRTAHG